MDQLKYPRNMDQDAKLRAYEALWDVARSRLMSEGYDVDDPWDVVNTRGRLTPESARAVHAALEGMVSQEELPGGCLSMSDQNLSAEEQVSRWACNRVFEVLMRMLIGAREVLDPEPVIRVAEWRLNDPLSRVHYLFFMKAPLKTVELAEDWLVRYVQDERTDITERGSMLDVLARVQPALAVCLARELLPLSPGLAATVLAGHGGSDEELLLTNFLAGTSLPSEDRRWVERHLRQLRKRLDRQTQQKRLSAERSDS